MEKTMRLENWKIIGNVAIGEVYGNPYFDDGEPVRTSFIKSREGNVITTLNSTYILGKEKES